MSAVGRASLVAAVAVDRVRGVALRRFCAVRPLRRFVIEPRHRLVLLELTMILLAAGLALRAPLVSLWIGSALFGVPHVIAGARAVAIKRRCSRVTLVCTALGLLLGLAQIFGAGDRAMRGLVVLMAIAIASEIVAARARPWVAIGALAAVAVGAATAVVFPAPAVVVLAHVHGLGALAFFTICARGRRLPTWPLLLGAGALTAAALFGLLDGAMASALYAPRGAARSIVAEAIGSAFAGTGGAGFRRALFLYAFGQSLHFGVWLRLMPEVDRPWSTPKTFRRALHDFEGDFGRWAQPLLLVAVIGIALLLVGGGPAREAYFALTYCHVGLEAAALARAGLRARISAKTTETRAPTSAPATIVMGVAA